MTTTFSGPVISTNGFIGDLTGSQVGYGIFPAATDYPTGVAEAISPSVRNATLSKGSAGTYTVAAPGATPVGWFLLITSTTAFAHTVTVTGLNTSTVITLPAVVGAQILLLAVSATVWMQIPTGLSGLFPYAAAPTAYAAGATEAISPSVANAALTKTTPAGTWTLAVPGAANVNRKITVYQTVALANVVTVTGLLGGTTLTAAVAIGASFTLLAIDATHWAVVALNGVTQTA
jgi:hypothetical protein